MRFSRNTDVNNPPPSGKAFAGLCADCRHSERVSSSRGSTFYLCRLSIADPRFAKYPRLPVLSCPGFEPEDTSGGKGRNERAGRAR